MNYTDISQSQRERLTYIDFTLYFLGQFNRSDIEARFGTRQAAATRDIALYKEMAPNNLSYDSTNKQYLIEETFKPAFEHLPVRVLAQLSRGFGAINAGAEKSYIPTELPYRLKYPSASVIGPITRAIHQERVVSITYVSTSSGKSNREVVPFALVDSGLRWHVRAFDRKKGRFSDFVLNRILESKVIKSDINDNERQHSDIQWNRIVELEIIPHPDRVHSEAIIHDYDMKDGVLHINARAAVAGYLLRRLNVDCTANHSLESPAYQLWLENRLALYGVDNFILAPGVDNLPL
ncbi:MAG: WYL domain-containing protein [Gammaproteobacteria bacterium]|nr:MAG: WYL domain-containing protein [Gammaproteobacteria bacterium]